VKIKVKVKSLRPPLKLMEDLLYINYQLDALIIIYS